jgi:hypothetical protein
VTRYIGCRGLEARRPVAGRGRDSIPASPAAHVRQPQLLARLLLAGDTADDPLGVRLAGPAAGAIIFGGYLVFRRYRLPDDVLGPRTSAQSQPLPFGLLPAGNQPPAVSG